MKYKLTNDNTIIRTEDNATIFQDVANKDYQAYLNWLEEGNTIETISTSVEPVSSVPQINISPTYDANIRNSIESEPQVVTVRSRLKLDGQLTGSFSHFPSNVWEAATSRILVSKEGEIYLARVSLIPSSLIPTILTIDLDLGGLVIYRKSFQPLSLSGDLVVETFPFFTSKTFVERGGTINITASTRTEIRNASLYLIKLPGVS